MTVVTENIAIEWNDYLAVVDWLGRFAGGPERAKTRAQIEAALCPGHSLDRALRRIVWIANERQR